MTKPSLPDGNLPTNPSGVANTPPLKPDVLTEFKSDDTPLSEISGLSTTTKENSGTEEVMPNVQSDADLPGDISVEDVTTPPLVEENIIATSAIDRQNDKDTTITPFVGLQTSNSTTPPSESPISLTESKIESDRLPKAEDSQVGAITFHETETADDLKKVDSRHALLGVAAGFFPKLITTKTRKSEKLPKKGRRWLFWFILSLIVASFLGAIGYAFYYYDHHVRSAEISQILPGDPHLAMRITINADADQYRLLEDAMERVPGYHILKKKLDDAGTGRSLSEYLREKLRENDLDYDADIKNVLADHAIVLIPDIMTLGDQMRGRVPGFSDIVTISNSNSSFIDKLELNQILPAQSPSITDISENGDVKQDEPISLDFIMAAEVKDLSEAKRVLKEMKGGRDDYDIVTKKANGLPYYHFKQTVSGENSVLGIGDMFHALIGGHWVMSTHEGYMTDALARKRSSGMFSFLHNGNAPSSLEDDETFKRVDDSLNKGRDTGLFSAYVNVNMAEFVQRSAGGDSKSFTDEYVTYPERYIAGLSLHVDENGIVINSVNEDERYSTENIANSSIKDGLVTSVPPVLNEKFADVYIEYDNLRSLYYSSKKNGLTDEGRTKVDDLRNDGKGLMGIDFETDIIDQLEGETAFVLYARANQAPEAAVLARIADPERMRITIENVINTLKVKFIGDTTSKVSRCQEQNEQIRALRNTPPEPSGFTFLFDQEEQDCQAIESLAESVRESGVVATQTDVGTIYSYKYPANEDISFDFGFNDNIMIFGSNFATIQSMLGSMSDGTVTTLASDEEFQAAFATLGSEGYAINRVKYLGLLNSITYAYEYYTAKIEDQFGQFTATEDLPEEARIRREQKKLESQKKTDDIKFLLGTYAQVFDTSASVHMIDGATISGGSRLEIKSLAPEDLERANAILDGL